MEGVKVQVEAVKRALNGKNATQSTVTLLQDLLSPDTVPDARNGTSLSNSNVAATTRGPGSTRVIKGTTRNTKAGQSQVICENAGPSLTARARYGLATEVVNMCLVELGDLAKTAIPSDFGKDRVPAKRIQSPQTAANEKPSLSHRALQPRSGNTTPVRVMQRKDASLIESTPKTASPNPCNATITAECARLAISFLRTVDTQKFGLPDIPLMQLDSASLALTGNLIALGLCTIAIRELRLIKRSLEGKFPVKAPSKKTQAGDTLHVQDAANKETLASLMHVEASFGAGEKILSLVTSYHFNVLKVIVALRRPAVIEELVHYLAFDNPNSMVGIIVRYSKLNDSSTAAKQLERLSQTILGLCPTVSELSDEQAKDVKHHPSPKTVFEVQVLALRIRKCWWHLANHAADVSKELIEPFFKCASAFQRRQRRMNDSSDIYECIAQHFQSLGPFDQAIADASLFNIHYLLCTEAERANTLATARKWVQEMSRNCVSLEDNHVRRLVCAVKRASILSMHDSPSVPQDDIDLVLERLKTKLTGAAVDYDPLLGSLAALCKVLRSGQTRIDPALAINLSGLAAAFALRYSRSYSERNTQHVRSILDTALRLSRSADDLLLWLTEDAAKIFTQDGTLQSGAQIAARKPLLSAWSCSSSAMALSQILRALLLRGMRESKTNTASVFDDPELNPSARGVVLEWQLKYAAELTTKVKYHKALRTMLPDLLGRLSKIYTTDEFPLRRARVAVIAFGIREANPDLILPHIFKPWQSTSLDDQTNLANDAELCDFFRDMKAGLRLAKALSQGQPSFEDILPSLKVWEELIDGCKDKIALCETVDDPQSLSRQLDSLGSYFAMLGEQHACVSTKRLQLKLVQLLEKADLSSLTVSLDLASQYIELGYAEKARLLLASAGTEPSKNKSLDALQYHIVHAQYALAVDDTNACRSALDRAREVRDCLTTAKISQKDQSSRVRSLARGCVISSKLMLGTGHPHESLALAKHAVKSLNGLWSHLLRSSSASAAHTSPILSEPSLTEPNERTRGVSKLQLTSDEDTKSSETSEHFHHGAAFWPVVPLLYQALLHLSNLYTHHGLYIESNYYSERAIQIAKSVSAPRMLMRIRSHRSRLLTLAGRVDEASLCLAQDDTDFMNEVSLASVERCCARAANLEKEGYLDEAAKQYQRAESMLETLSREDFIVRLERLGDGEGDLEAQTASLSLDNEVTLKPKTKKGHPRAQSAPCKAPPKRQPAGDRPMSHSRQATQEAVTQRPYLLEKTLADLLVRRALLPTLGGDLQPLLSKIDILRRSELEQSHQCLAQFQKLMQDAKVALGQDVTLNVLEDSTLSLPAVTSLPDRLDDREKTPSIQSTSDDAPLAQDKKKGRTKSKASSKDSVGARCTGLLEAAKRSLSTYSVHSNKICGTARTYVETSKILSANLLLSAISRPKAGVTPPHPDDRMMVELPRTKALAYELRALAIDRVQEEVHECGSLPAPAQQPHAEVLTSDELNACFIDQLPKSWTVVSLSLNEDASELYIARYRADQEPFILRLPFSRHRTEGQDEEPFNYHHGKAELQEIIELSNYTCHNPGNLEGKGVKSKWWKEREALDRRLQELLVNVESIWIGGFKGVLATQPRRVDLLKAFRGTFEGILDRYLPSRTSAKQLPHLVLHDHVLELFTGLGDDQDGVIDFDEPLSDLLYFVVDMLQFSGERNAYDEIDFDSMAVDMLDALRSYHSNSTDAAIDSQHLILILEKRLQAFPWESMPCLQEANVSRVGSMLSLKTRLQPQRAMQYEQTSKSVLDGHVLHRASGTYILNPSGDLRGTQDMLQPVLSKLGGSTGAKWHAIVNEPPDEARFVSALEGSSMLLYFGHGAGSQFIRPRSIKRLDRCCDVVWLMGCSSGMVIEYGELEPTAIPLNYLLAGECSEGGDSSAVNNCKAIVATLWDVTDKDIDRFSLALGEEWGLWPASEQSKLPVKTPKKRQVVAAPSTPQQLPKTPKTPRVVKSPAPLKTPVRSRARRSQASNTRKVSIVEAVSRSRDACYLRYLNGAATVVYGVPVYLGD